MVESGGAKNDDQGGALDPLLTIERFDHLREVVLGCTRCGLRDGCKGVVFGEGDSQADVMVIGEGPGADEDRLGRPFVGRAGRLLDQMLGAAGFDRSTHVFITNVVKCRPPGNRPPTREEQLACLPNLFAQMRLIRPKIVLLLGSTALKALIDPKGMISRTRGNWVQKAGVWIMPTYHPAALLRNPSLKRPVWDDLQQMVAKYQQLVDPTHRIPDIKTTGHESGAERIE